MKLVNLTDHVVNVTATDGKTYSFPPRPKAQGGSARLDEIKTPAGKALVDFAAQFDVASVSYGEVTGLPDPDPTGGTGYIVSRLLAEACPERGDLYFPLGLVRGTAGQPAYARRLGRAGR